MALFFDIKTELENNKEELDKMLIEVKNRLTLQGSYIIEDVRNEYEKAFIRLDFLNTIEINLNTKDNISIEETENNIINKVILALYQTYPLLRTNVHLKKELIFNDLFKSHIKKQELISFLEILSNNNIEDINIVIKNWEELPLNMKQVVNTFIKSESIYFNTTILSYSILINKEYHYYIENHPNYFETIVENEIISINQNFKIIKTGVKDEN
jgi:hypothetical protein